MELLIGVYVLFVVPWVVASCFRILQYAQYLQALEHDTNEYWLRVKGGKVESRYLQIFISLLVILIVVSCCGSIYLPRIIYQSPFSIMMVNLGFLLLAIIFAPRSILQQKTFPFSWRKIRLIIVGFLLSYFPLLRALALSDIFML